LRWLLLQASWTCQQHHPQPASMGSPPRNPAVKLPEQYCQQSYYQVAPLAARHANLFSRKDTSVSICC
jgi:hypothetical protein